jgi:hypothetical protein
MSASSDGTTAADVDHQRRVAVERRSSSINALVDDVDDQQPGSSSRERYPVAVRWRGALWYQPWYRIERSSADLRAPHRA